MPPPGSAPRPLPQEHEGTALALSKDGLKFKGIRWNDSNTNRHTGSGRNSYASVKWPGGPSHLGRARLVGAGACGVREDSANARGGGAGVCAHVMASW